ncbi:hypothetical protein GPECTOR_6g785 [Gonium pectorale]|uniref:Cilium assembly protein DZIP1 N-terminal domain-containing protein n=1 Tax=Gonium pectorale TaxID=33097 RepID=A0A150GVF8_GONPE|nr:hypothetical protein GPECTOR_6g785 [Gonium pectorale]|eukprot:KXZ53867.1 hypothetical protein GPECTOR_6g785 [Gonium pectorale]
MSGGRQPQALNLAGFQFTYRSSYFDWRLLHGIDVDNVIRLTDVAAIEDCLHTLQTGCFPAERDRLSPANCVQLFRLLQLSIEYCAHLRAAHATLLDCYNVATSAADSWKAAARAYLDAGSVFLSESLATAALSRSALDATDAARAALEGADRDYNSALDTLEAEDSRARHFRFRKHRTEISWSTLHATDADRLVSTVDVGALEGLMPNLTYGSITNEDDEQLTPHHFSQIIPLAQAALDYVLWQANATGALLEQAMSTLQAACGDIPLLTSATQDMHSNISSLCMEAQQLGGALGPGAGAGIGGARAAGAGFGPRVSTSGAFGSASVALGGAGGGATGLGASVDSAYGGSPGLAGPFPSASVEVLRLGSATPGLSRFATGPIGAGSVSGVTLAGALAGGSATPVGGYRASAALEELLAAAAAASTDVTGSSALPVLDLHSRTVDLSAKVDAIEQDLRMERSKTEEMRRILSDIRERLNHQRRPSAGAVGVLSPSDSLTFTPAAAAAAVAAAGGAASGSGGGLGSFGPVNAAASLSGAAGGPGAGRGGSAAGVSVSVSPRYAEHSPAKVRVFVDEDVIREQERQRAVEVLSRQAERLKQQMLREHTERRLATSAAAASASLQLQQLAAGSGGGASGIAARLAQQEAALAGDRQSRGVSRDSSRRSVRNSSPGGRPGRSGAAAQQARHHHRSTRQVSGDYSSDPEYAALASAAASMSGPTSGAGRYGGAGAGGGPSRPPKPLSRLSGPTAVHGSLGDLPSAAAGSGMRGPGGDGSFAEAQRLALPPLPATDDSDTAPPPAPRPPAPPAQLHNTRMATGTAFGSISYVGPAADSIAANAAAAASRQLYGASGSGVASKASSFTDRQLPERPTQGSRYGAMASAPGELQVAARAASGISASGWDAAGAVAASVRGGRAE